MASFKLKNSLKNFAFFYIYKNKQTAVIYLVFLFFKIKLKT